MTMLALEEERKFNLKKQRKTKKEKKYEHTRECPDCEEFSCGTRPPR
jgi:hypothetical protein